MDFKFIPNHLDDTAKPCESSQNPEKHTNAVNIKAQFHRFGILILGIIYKNHERKSV